MEEITLHVKLNAKCIDIGGYITYVFENLNYKNYDDQYVMCVQFPNWNQSEINIGETGFVNLRYVKEGISQWYDGDKMNFYKYTNIIFLKFIKDPEKIEKEYIID